MPDLDIVGVHVCSTLVDEFETTVKGSKGAEYQVHYGRLYGSELQRQGCEYGWTCTCKGFQFRGTCKHVNQVKPRLCHWNYEMDPGHTAAEMFVCPDCGAHVAADEDGCCRYCGKDCHTEACCPNCGGPVTAMRVGV